MIQISVIIPVFNSEQYLSCCLDSVVNQTFSDIEIICVNDGSTDRSIQILQNYAAIDARVTIVNQDNHGLVNARKVGLSKANGKYITFVDSDDWLEADAIEKLYAIVLKNNVDCICTDCFTNTGDRQGIIANSFMYGRYDKQQLASEIYPHMMMNGDFFTFGIFPSVWGKLFVKKSLDSVMPLIDERIIMGEDAALIFTLLTMIDSLYISEECFYHYRQTTTSMIKNKFPQDHERELYKILNNTVKKNLKSYGYLQDQWIKHILFLMVQRSDTLYEGITDLPILFPFPCIRKGTDILLYGAGTYGQRLYNYLYNTKFVNVRGWYDINAVYLIKNGINVLPPEAIAESDTNDIVIALMYASTRKNVYNELHRNYPNKKIHMIDEDTIFSRETLNAFRLV